MTAIIFFEKTILPSFLVGFLEFRLLKLYWMSFDVSEDGLTLGITDTYVVWSLKSNTVDIYDIRTLDNWMYD
jgi:hypothetical protein